MGAAGVGCFKGKRLLAEADGIRVDEALLDALRSLQYAGMPAV